jgi:hypothetical protein
MNRWRFISLCLGALLPAFWFAVPCAAQSEIERARDVHLEYKPALKLDATLTAIVNPFTGRLYLAKPRNGLNQRDVVAKLYLGGERSMELPGEGFEISPARFPVFYVDVANAETAVEARFTATMYTCSLLPGKPRLPVSPLKLQERAFYTSLNTYSMIHNEGQLRAWIEANQLTRAPIESDVQFARRVHEFMRANFTYGWSPTSWPTTSAWALEAVVMGGRAECYGLSRIFVAVLRANGIPSRALPGRMIKDGGTHVKAEFYADGVGWVPVEVAGGVSDKTRPLSNYFGKDIADMFILPQATDYSLPGPKDPVVVGSWNCFGVVRSDGTSEFPLGIWQARTTPVRATASSKARAAKTGSAPGR